MAYYAIQAPSFPCDEALRFFNGDQGRGCTRFVWGTFGGSNRCLNKFMAQNPGGEIIVDLTNEVGRKKGNLAGGELFRKYSPGRYDQALKRRSRRVTRRIQRRIERIETTFQGYSGRVILSTGLEHQCSRKGCKNLAKIAKEAWPYETAFNPSGNSYRGRFYTDTLILHNIGSTFTEKQHGRCVLSNDGEGIDFGNVSSYPVRQRREDVLRAGRRALREGCDFYLWEPEQQGLLSDSGASIKPRSRNYRVFRENVDRLKLLAKEIKQ